VQERLEGLWREMEAFARNGTAAHEVERRLFREVLRLGFLLLGYFFGLVGSGDQGGQGSVLDLDIKLRIQIQIC
jgi:hypothetical protein